MHSSRNVTRSDIETLLLLRRGLVFAETIGQRLQENYVQAFELELAELGYVLSTRLRARLACLSLDEMAHRRDTMGATLAAAVGGDRKHVPLFRGFPHGVPSDTHELWWRKVLSHYLQRNDQPCIHCGSIGTCFVLDPCRHVVCGHCYDGANYSACPVCEHRVNGDSPFFKPSPKATTAFPASNIRFKRLDLGENLDAEARALFVSLCERKQALSPADVDAFAALIDAYREVTLGWLPESIPVKENVAIVFGSLFRHGEANAIWPVAKRYIGSATDVLRIIAVFSGADASLQGQSVVKQLPGRARPSPVVVHRFAMAKLGRPLRRALLQILEGFEENRLVEDMLRHDSYWVWVGQFLHPHEYADRFPRVARVFAIVRKKGPDGLVAPAFQSYYAQLDAAIRTRNFAAMTELLRARPGELARRFDHALRVVQDDEHAVEELMNAFVGSAAAFSTPVLLTLRNTLPTRSEKAPVRVYWPKGQVSKGVSSPDTRPVLNPSTISTAVEAIEGELLRRFAAKPAISDMIVDEALRRIPVPFNERTASRSAVSLPRGARIQVPRGKMARLFLHWCEPEIDGSSTDIDLSVGFYDAHWNYVGVCSYYELTFVGPSGTKIATSAGDLRDAPYPDGATEFIDLHRDRALAEGIRYAVMVVNNYAGMPFSRLERGFAGLMLRDHADGPHFDPRAVELKFALQGDNGVFLPLVFDLEESTMHWLDTYAKGQFEFNNVASSNQAITKICPELMTYFGSGVRMSMCELALLHAAARAERVFVRGETTRVFTRDPGETPLSFLRRLQRPADPASRSAPLPGPESAPVAAVLYRGDIDLPTGSVTYALFREALTSTIAASDLIS